MNVVIPGGRKFFLTLGCGVACTLLVWFTKISDAVFATIILGTVGAYITGNVYQKAQQPDAGA
jgi:uncharacterized membrane protein YeaQ/YmgE (transglycosylase-associated protein family)